MYRNNPRIFKSLRLHSLYKTISSSLVDRHLAAKIQKRVSFCYVQCILIIFWKKKQEELTITTYVLIMVEMKSEEGLPVKQCPI